jgi:hypothetical protein
MGIEGYIFKGFPHEHAFAVYSGRLFAIETTLRALNLSLDTPLFPLIPPASRAETNFDLRSFRR